MKAMRTMLLLTLLAVLSLSFVERSEAKVYASNVRVTQESSTAPFDGSFADRSGAAIRFYLNQAADSVVVDVVPFGGGPSVKTLRKSNVAQGDNSFIWNGSNNSNTPAPTGSYKIQVAAYHHGFASYTQTSYITSPNSFIFTRGVSSVTNPAMRQFGALYSVSGGGYASGITRHSSWGANWGNVPGVPDSALMISTGVVLGGTLDRRYSPVVDQDGYAYVLGRTDVGATPDIRKIYRFHIDTLDVALFDSSSYGTQIQGSQVVGSGDTKALIVTGDSMVFNLSIATQSFNTVPPTPIARVLADKRMVFWDAKLAADSSLYVIWRADSSWGPYVGKNRGIMKFNLKTGTLPKTVADTVWTSGIPDGDPVTLAVDNGATAAGSDDILYMNSDIAAPNTFASGIYAYTNLTASSPTRSVAWADPDNNCSSNRSALTLDVLGNVFYFENSNEQVVQVSPPSGPNSYVYTSVTPFSVSAAGVAPILYTIAEARIDINGDRRPDRLGDTVKVVGIINSTNVQTTNTGYFMQDATAGIHLFAFGQVGLPVLRPGYRVEVIGAIAYFNGTTEISPANLATDITILDSGNVLTPIPLTIGQYKADPETYESRLIQFNVANPAGFTAAQWPAAGSSANLNIWDGQDTTILRIDSDTEVDGSPFPVFPVRLSGIGTQFSTTGLDGYQITPFFVTDFVPINAPPSANFHLISPANGSAIVIDSTASYTFKWHPAIDFNNDALIYQFKPVAFAGVLSTAGDTTVTRTGAQLLTYLGSNEVSNFRWTVLAKDTPNPIVSSRDTFSVTLYRSFVPPAAGWNAQTSGITTALYSVKAVTPAVAWAAGAGGKVLLTTNAGTTWTSVGGGGIGTGDIYAIDAVSSTTALVTTTPSTISYLFRTTNSGTTWDTVYTQTGGFLDAIKMFDPTNGIAMGDPVGGKWTVLRTTNGGSSWARIATEPTQVGSEAGSNNGMATVGTSNIWFASNTTPSRVYRSADGGATWSGVNLPFTASFTAGLWFNDPWTGVVSANGGQAARTTDGGVTWSLTTLPSSGASYAVAGANGTFFASRGSIVAVSNDQGQTWAQSYAGGIGTTLNHLSMVAANSNIAGWLVSGTGGIASFYGTVTGVGDPLFNGIPETFELSQNYPNPFNPSTTIRYSLPKDAFVSLKVYNVLGQEVATLKEEFQSVGTFTIVWNGRNRAGNQVASGMYLYRIEARPADGGQPFTSLKKMVLLK